ncbi:ABC transporter substrate-binding protein [Pyruvatibacter sp.]|uniref:heme/hemin ABC transporter substrate-binding protein n=1 Tax=Pyruvatibacter sp. TaxID=1981328 RepID=UPI0032ECBCF3
MTISTLGVRTFFFTAALVFGGGAAPLTGTSPDARAEALQAPERIVSVGGAVTETLYALGLGGKLLAADTTSMYPAEARALPKVGYLRQLSAEGVLGMRPDLILLGEGAGPAAAVEQIKSADLDVIEIGSPWTPDGIGSLIETVGNATGHAARAADFAITVATQFSELKEAIPTKEQPSVLLVLNAGTGPLFGAGTNTAAEAIITMAGGRLALPTLDGYKPLSLEPVLTADPDYILIPNHVVMALGGEEALANIDVISKTTAGREGRIIVADSLYLLGFGPRTPQAIADLAELFHPDADIPLAGRAQAPSGQMYFTGS